MSDVTLDQVLQMIDQLSVADRAALIRYLQMPAYQQGPITLEMIKAEHARRLAAGAFEKATSLRNKYAKPELNLSDEELRTSIKAFSREWEEELDDLTDDD